MFQFPLNDLSVTSRFIVYNPGGQAAMHYAMDFGCATGTPVYSANAGTVVLSTYDSAGGNMIGILDAASGEFSRYAHLSRRDYTVGDMVSMGQLIGLSGNTGTETTGPHLHFETWLVPKGYGYRYSDRAKYAVDPMSVCHLMHGQTFKNNGLATAEPIPYPEPSIQTIPVQGTVTVTNGSVRLRMIPEKTRFQYIVGGQNRSNDILSELLSGESFQAVATASNDGEEWALISTERGLFWVALIDGYTTLEKSTQPSTPEPLPSIDSLNTQIVQLTERVDALNEIISDYTYRLNEINRLSEVQS